MIIQARAWNFVQLLHFLVCRFAVSLHPFLSMSFHVVGPRYCLCVRFVPPRCSSVVPAENGPMIVSFGLHSRWVHPRYTWSSISTCSSISSASEPYSFPFQPFWCHPHRLTEITLVSDERKYNPNSEFCPIQFPNEKSFCEVSFLQQSGCWLTVHMSFKMYHGLFKISPWFWAFVSWKKYPNIWAFRFRSFEQSGSIFHLACQLGRRRALLLNTAYAPESSFTMSPRSTTLPLYFCNLGSN